MRSFSSAVGFERLSTSFQKRPVPSRARSATSRWSRTVIPWNSSMRWNVRANPSRARRYTGSRVMSCPLNSTRPASGRSSPSRQLKNVVFPAPLGPMSPTDSPSSTVIETSSSAVMPENRFVIPDAANNAI